MNHDTAISRPTGDSTQSTRSTLRQHFDVAVIGYGPVGATLAGLLGRAGLTVGVFDKAGAIYPQPRAVGFDHDAMRLFQRMGAAQALAPHIADFRDSCYYGADGQLIRKVARLPPPFPLHWAPNYTCDQPAVEAVLRATVDAMPAVDVHLDSCLTGLHDDGQGVRFAVREEPAQSTQHYSAAYLVGCDGASSTVRRSIRAELASMAYDEPWIVVDLHVDPAYLDQLPQTNVQYCEPQRPSTYIVCPGNHRRWEFMVLEGEPREGELSEQRLWALLQRWVDPAHARIWRAAAYRFHALVARQWDSGRVFLAGDSAHQTPPFLGQGMCQGLRDAGNLAWKLAMVVQGRADTRLLQTYTEERRPHVQATTLLAKEIGYLLSERDPLRARARDARLLAEGGGSARTLIRQEMIPGITHGLIAADAPLAGVTLPQPRVRNADGRNCLLDDLHEPVFQILASRRADIPGLRELAQAAGVALVVVCNGSGAAGDDPPESVSDLDGLLLPWFEAHGVQGVLARPDHYVYGGFTDLAGARSLLHMLENTRVRCTPALA